MGARPPRPGSRTGRLPTSAALHAPVPTAGRRRLKRAGRTCCCSVGIEIKREWSFAEAGAGVITEKQV